MTISLYFEFPRSEFVPLIYARWATVTVVILIQISFNVTSAMNCQVRAYPADNFLHVLTFRDPKAWVWTSWVSIRLALMTSYGILFLPDFLSLAFAFPGHGTGSLFSCFACQFTALLYDNYVPEVYAYGGLRLRHLGQE